MLNYTEENGYPDIKTAEGACQDHIGKKHRPLRGLQEPNEVVQGFEE